MVFGVAADTMPEGNEVGEDGQVLVASLVDVLADARLLGDTVDPVTDDEEASGDLLGPEITRELQRHRVRTVVPGQRDDAIWEVRAVDWRTRRAARCPSVDRLGVSDPCRRTLFGDLVAPAEH